MVIVIIRAESAFMPLYMKPHLCYAIKLRKPANVTRRSQSSAEKCVSHVILNELAGEAAFQQLLSEIPGRARVSLRNENLTVAYYSFSQT